MRRLWAVEIASLLTGCGASGGIGLANSPTAGAAGAAAASCAALTAAQQFNAASVVFDGTMRPGPTVVLGGGRILSSPALVWVSRYLKGHGPRAVRVQTAADRAGSGRAVAEDGIEPRAGQRWRIYSDRSREPFTSSICGGSRLLKASRETARRFTGSGVSFAYPSAWHAHSYTVPSSFSAAVVSLSPQRLHPPCITRHGSQNSTITCSQAIAHLQPGSVLVNWSINAMPGWSFTRAQGTPLRVGGRPAKLAVTHDTCEIGADEVMETIIAIPGSSDSWYQLNACIRAPGTSTRERQVRLLLKTVRFTS